MSLILKCKEDSILIVADKLRLNQVFLNIINNAINIVKRRRNYCIFRKTRQQHSIGKNNR